jgi:dTDP-4-amino-4,6-dideoxygalactose transaminase
VFGMDSRALMGHLDALGIQTRPLWRPLHLLEPYREAAAWTNGVAERLYADALSLPSSVGLTLEDARRVAAAIETVGMSRRP